MSTKARSAAVGVLIVGVVVLVIAAASGVLYEQMQRARDRENFPQIGRSVNIGGRMLNIDCSGAGQPAVILESGAPWAFYSKPREMWENGAPRPGYSWVAIQRELAPSTTTCWYDPAGSGWSDPGPYPRDSASQARDLHALLEAARVPPPYVLVAESSAALDARVFTGFYPAEVAGLVLVNGVHPDLLIRIGRGRGLPWPGFVSRSQDASARIFSLIGLYRFGSANHSAPAPPPKRIASAEWNTIWHLTQAPKARAALIQDIASRNRSSAEARAAGSLGGRPLVVVSSENIEAASAHPGLWMELQTDLARLSTHGKAIVVEGGSDLVYRSPGAVIEAVRQILSAVGDPTLR